jgi:hypothetical protein
VEIDHASMPLAAAISGKFAHRPPWI